MVKKTLMFILFLIITASPLTIFANDVNLSHIPLRDRFAGFEGRPITGRFIDFADVPNYYQILDIYQETGIRDANTTVEAALDFMPLVEFHGRQAFLWTRDVPFIEFEVFVEHGGLYQLELDYYLFTDATIPAIRSVRINGELPFIEASDLIFYRYFRDRNEPVINTLGDETRPSQVDIPGWRTQRVIDSTGHTEEPFRFHLKQGINTVTMGFTRQDMAVSGIRFVPPNPKPSYEIYIQNKRNAGFRPVNHTIGFEAETSVTEKNSPVLRREVDLCPTVTPRSITYRVLNVMGGWRWRLGNQSITWEFDVPEDGLYTVGVRVKQTWSDGLPSFRQIAFNGEVPFEELLAYRFPYNRQWDLHILSDETGTPFEIFLPKGRNTLTMTVKYGELSSIIHSIRDDIQLLSDIMMQITMITGSTPDPNYDYLFFERLPGLENDMRNLAESMTRKHALSLGITERTPAMANNFLTIQEQLDRMVANPFSIARRFNDLIAAQESLGVWYIELQNQPLMVDSFLVGGINASADWANPRASVFQRIRTTWANFIASFTRDFTNIGGILDEHVPVHNTIDVWIARGMEWAEAIKEMADEDFTPYTGIAINVNVVPAGQIVAGNVNAIMLAIAAGRAPDVVLGADAITPVEFAIRGAVQDLSGMPGFDEVAARFVPATLTPFKYEGGIYALPETMNFNVMFYRKDILSMLGLQIPETRNDLYEFVLPILYQNGMEFFYAGRSGLVSHVALNIGREFSQFLFQHGGDFYTDDLLRSGLYSPEAFRAFEEYTQIFTHYGIPLQANFYQRLRMGIMPIGIGDFGTYMQLSVAAPELVGRWGIAPLPGIRREDGIIDRTAGGISAQSVMVLSQSEAPEDAWEFIKWWTSAETQTAFAREVEALIGAEARWNTANIEAFMSLPWSDEEIEVIQEQWYWAREVPTILGGYFTNRYIMNAWTTVVMEGGNPRDALEQAVREINRELRMRQEEYGIFSGE